MSKSADSLLNDITRRFTVGQLVFVLLLGVIIVTAINIASVYMVYSEFRTLDNSVDVAGEQRMLSQRMARFTNHLATGTASPETDTQLAEAADRYESNLQTLRNGGEADGYEIDPAPGSTHQQLDQQRAIWNEYHRHVDTILESEPDDPEFDRSVQYVRTHSDELLETSDETVNVFTQYAQSKIQFLQLLLVGLFVSNLVIFVVGGYLTQRYIGTILADVTRAIESTANGSMDTKLSGQTRKLAALPDDKTRNEVVKLTKATEELESHLKCVVQQTKALAEQNFDDDVLEGEVPGEFGTALEKMQTQLRDLISSLRDSERRMKTQRDSLKILNKTVRHDIRNDLQLVLSYAEILEGDIDGDSEQYRQKIHTSAQNAVDITETARDVTDVMLQTEVDREPVPLRSTLLAEIDTIRSNNTDVIIEIDGSIPDVTVYADDLLDAVFRNLLKNAVIHNDKDIVEITVTGGVDTDRAIVRISDNGPGIPDSLKEDIFDEGEKGLDSGGTGLGLYLVKTLVNRYRGDVSVDDNDPVGTVFGVELPVCE